MKISKRILVSALILSMVILLIPGNTTATQAAKKPKLSKTRVSITVGKTKTVKMKNSAKKAKVSWKTSNKKVAKITKNDIVNIGLHFFLKNVRPYAASCSEA